MIEPTARCTPSCGWETYDRHAPQALLDQHVADHCTTPTPDAPPPPASRVSEQAAAGAGS